MPGLADILKLVGVLGAGAAFGGGQGALAAGSGFGQSVAQTRERERQEKKAEEERKRQEKETRRKQLESAQLQGLLNRVSIGSPGSTAQLPQTVPQPGLQGAIPPDQVSSATSTEVSLPERDASVNEIFSRIGIKNAEAVAVTLAAKEEKERVRREDAATKEKHRQENFTANQERQKEAAADKIAVSREAEAGRNRRAQQLTQSSTTKTQQQQAADASTLSDASADATKQAGQLASAKAQLAQSVVDVLNRDDADREARQQQPITEAQQEAVVRRELKRNIAAMGITLSDKKFERMLKDVLELIEVEGGVGTGPLSKETRERKTVGGGGFLDNLLSIF